MREEFNKYKKTLIILISCCVILSLISIISNSVGNSNRIIKNYILSHGFELDDDEIFYKKELDNITYDEYLNNINNNIDSTYRVLYFDIYTYTLNINRYDYYDGVKSYLTSVYDYRDNSLSYTYTINYESSNIIYKGTYNSDKFTCENEYKFDALINNDDIYCNVAEEYVREFNDIALETISSNKILNYMKK